MSNTLIWTPQAYPLKCITVESKEQYLVIGWSAEGAPMAVRSDVPATPSRYPRELHEDVDYFLP